MSKLYKLQPEHEARFGEWRDLWIARGMRAKLQTPEERERVVAAVEGLYRAAKLTPPPRNRIVFVPCPIMGQFVAGFAASIWHRRKNAATYAATADATADATYAATRDATYAATADATAAATDAATYAATRDATAAATDAATYAATYAATRDATYAATADATDAATYAATYAATRDATAAATDAATYAATRDATRDATAAATDAATADATYAATADATADATDWKSIALSILGKAAIFGIKCAAAAYNMRAGGNQWGAWAAFLSFFRHVAQLPLDYSKWDHYETLATLAGPRWMHPEFCIISDFPEVLTVDAGNRPHNESGPFCRWANGGQSLYAIHGVTVAPYIVEHPEQITVEKIHAEQNAEVRRVMIERYGLSRYVKDAEFEVLDTDTDSLGLKRRLLRKGNLVVAEAYNSTPDHDGTYRIYHMPLHPELRPMHMDGTLGEPQKFTVVNAIGSTYGCTGKEYVLQIET